MGRSRSRSPPRRGTSAFRHRFADRFIPLLPGEGLFLLLLPLLRVLGSISEPSQGGKEVGGSCGVAAWDLSQCRRIFFGKQERREEAEAKQSHAFLQAERRRSRSTSRERERRRRERSRSRDRDRRRSRSRSPHRRRSRSPRRHRSSSSSPPRLKERRDEEKKEIKDSKGKERQITEEDLQGKTEEEIEMMKMMGFASFDTTKGKKVDGAANAYAINVSQKRKYRQYMNRKGGFNRPLDFIA
ncbi:U4/U6.U5 small nuclear ribonucleoprotein 27 kDa protein isoform X1 [Larus michahellis]|uniref:U4/U6.U5 small nuclear ribonucleoprotein 27 kDa protein isoform X1 n=1 Tax=Larus michahellis TaxID=119627 RepID=UPI003D9BB465